MSMPLLASAVLEMSACWQVRDLLTFCCQMLMVLRFLMGWAFQSAVLLVLIISSNRTALGCCQ